jgi:ADP-ribosylglycohydrolase
MKRRSIKKLQLKKATLSNLTHNQLDAIKGAAAPTSPIACSRTLICPIRTTTCDSQGDVICPIVGELR